MSLTAMGKGRALEEAAPAAPKPGDQPAAPPPVPTPQTAQAGLIGQLIGYVPAESLAAYVATTAFILDSSEFWRFVVLAVIGLIVTPLWVVIAYRDATNDPAVLRTWPWFQMIVGTGAFVAWSTSVPGSWWQLDRDLSSQAGGGIAVGAAVLIAVVVRYWQQQHRVSKVVAA